MLEEVNLSLVEKKRLWSKTRLDNESKCLEWQGTTDRHGYGQIKFRGQRYLVHRVSYFVCQGEVPPVVLHTCDNRLCINPKHLEAGTQLDNIRDMVKKRRHRPFGRKRMRSASCFN